MVTPFSVVRYLPIASKLSNASPIGSIIWWQPLQLLPAASWAAKRSRAVGAVGHVGRR